jgi:hypothetical protein
MAKEKWTVIYKIEDDGTQSTFNAVSGGWTEKSVLVEGKKEESAAYTLEEKSGLIQGTPQKCKMVTVEAGSEKECWAALKKVLGADNANGPALTVLASALKEQA